MVAPLLDRDDWSTITEPWTRDQWLTYFFPVARAHVVQTKKAWVANTPTLDMDELISVGSMALVTAYDKWPAYAGRTGTDPESRIAFWGFARSRINFDLVDFQRALLGRSPGARAARAALSVDANADEAGDAIALFIAQPLDRSLQLEVCATITQLTLPQQTVLSLVYIEGLKRAEVATLTGLDLPSLRTVHDSATAQLLAAAHRSTGRDTADPVLHDQPDATLDALTSWLTTHDYPSLESYLASALDAYLEDVGILASIFNAAHKISAIHSAKENA
jgi:hypothetical protein